MSETVLLSAQYAVIAQRRTMVPNRILLGLLKFMLRTAGLVFRYVISFFLLIMDMLGAVHM
jgi:hypothetical protein